MLDLDLDLEADLGIDTVKQAKMFAAVRGAFDIPRDENLKLRDFPTLAHVIKFAEERRAALATPTVDVSHPSLATNARERVGHPQDTVEAPIEIAAVSPQPTSPATIDVEDKVLEIVAEK